jgi:hypothetical protein
MGRLGELPKAGPCLEVRAALRDLHLLAGEPSMRTIARSTGALSHDTVHRVLTGPGLPRWGPLELVVEALGGDVEAFRQLWVTARRALEHGHG